MAACLDRDNGVCDSSSTIKPQGLSVGSVFPKMTLGSGPESRADNAGIFCLSLLVAVWYQQSHIRRPTEWAGGSYVKLCAAGGTAKARKRIGQ
jgi:hypothetical protein